MERSKESEASATPRRVLVVDYDASARRAVRDALESDGFAVLEAVDGRRARQLLEDTDVDAVVTEIYMPEEDGLELITWMQRTLPNTPVVAVSGGGSLGDLTSLVVARAFGAHDVLQKPFGATVILAVMRRVLEDGRPAPLRPA
jgi:DNA-binding response OmpR family regulator